MVKHSAGVRIEKIKPRFDDSRLVSDAGLIIPATLAERLGLAELVSEKLDLGSRPGAARPEQKAMTLIHAMLAGADSIDGCDILRSGATGAVLEHKVMAPSTLGTFLRSMSFGHVRQLEAVASQLLRRAWSAGAGPKKDERLTIDLDSFVGQVHGYQKQGASYGYTHEFGLHPLLATRAGTGEVLGIRLREGSANTQRGIQRFLEELIPRVKRAGATGEILIRADSGFWRNATFEFLEEQKATYSIGVRQQGKVPGAIAGIPDSAWTQLAAIAHNLARFSQVIALPGASPRVLATFQRRLLRIPGRIQAQTAPTTLRCCETRPRWHRSTINRFAEHRFGCRDSDRTWLRWIQA
ncbi:MAG: hypothetical protein QG596_157 [Actinomycetota bacterium]|jgi:hypothetical protein|nr:hypothetical protein [Actinomycetota bacterium]